MSLVIRDMHMLNIEHLVSVNHVTEYSCCFGSINGENIHYGTPRNPCAADRVPGGSSSGSAVAVGAKLVNFSLGELFFHSMSLFWAPLC